MPSIAIPTKKVDSKPKTKSTKELKEKKNAMIKENPETPTTTAKLRIWIWPFNKYIKIMERDP